MATTEYQRASPVERIEQAQPLFRQRRAASGRQTSSTANKVRNSSAPR